jgi:hypothetical protein
MAVIFTMVLMVAAVAAWQQRRCGGGSGGQLKWCSLEAVVGVFNGGSMAAFDGGNRLW